MKRDKRFFFVLALTVLFSVCATSVGASAEEEKLPLAYTLDECIHMAKRQSPAILAAREEMNRTRGVILEAWSSILSLNAEGNYTYMETPQGMTIPANSFAPSVPSSDIFLGSTSNKSYTIAADASIPLFTGGRVISGISVAYLQDDIAVLEYRKATAETVYGVKTAFYGILLAKDLVRVRTEALDLLVEHYETTKKKYDVGVVSRFDLLRSEVELANARPPLIEAKNDLAISYENLKRILGVDVDEPFEIEGTLELREVDVSLDDFLDRAAMSSPDLVISEKLETIAKKNVKMAVGEFLPTVTAFARYEWASDEFHHVDFNEDDWEYTFGAVVTVPIFDLLISASKLKQVRAEYEMAQIGYLDTSNSVKVNVKEAYYDLVEASEIIESQRLNIEVAEESLRIAEVRYDNGISTLLELLDTQLAVTEAKLNYLNALFNFEESYARLISIVGGEGEGEE
jgi:outer membrane protein TolC